MEQYCMYLRKSRKDIELEARGEGETLARHRNALYALAKQKGIHVTKVFEEVVSGDSIDARPRMKDLLREVEQDLWAGVLVMEVERLARGDTTDQGRVAKAFKYSETLIVTPNKTFDPLNEHDEEYFEFGLFMSRRELKTITRRLQRGRVDSVKEGKYAGNNPPYGYRRVKLTKEKGWSLSPIQEEAEIVRLVFDLYTTGELQADGSYDRLGVRRIARKLNKMNIAPRRGTDWTPGSIRDILINPHYIGLVRWNWRPAKKRMVDGEIEISRPRSTNLILANGLHKPIVEKSAYYTAQEFLAKNPVKPRHEGRAVKNPWAGLIKCGKCHRTMTRRPYKDNKQSDTILCQHIKCDNVSSELHIVEARILEGLSEWLSEYRLRWETGKPAADKKRANNIAVIQRATTKQDKELKTLDSQRRKAQELVERGIYDDATYTKRIAEITKQITQSEKNRAALEKELALEEARSAARIAVIPKAEKLLEVYRELPAAADKNELLKEVLEKAVYIKHEKGRRNGKTDTFEITLYPKLPKSLAN